MVTRVCVEREEATKTTARPMDIANLVTPSATTFSAASGTKRTFDELTKDEDPDAAAQFYGNLQRNAMSDRADSLLFHMRAMNNWVKSILINEFAKRDDRVLDLACGKGGDLMKWAKRSISKYVGVDIAQKSLEDAVDRFSSNGHHHRELDVQFIQGDLGKVSLLEDVLHCWTRNAGWHEAVPSLERAFFNIVSIQFSFHYMFGEEQRASRFFRTVHDLLVDGGTLIATTVDPNKVLMKYYQNLGPDSENVDAAQGQRQRPDISIVDNKQREVCAIRFDDETRSQLTGYNVQPEGAFGLRYNFTLRDTTDTEGGDAMGGGEAVDLPEYLVCDDVLKRMLKEHGFELLLQQNFHHFVTTNKDKRENRMLLEKMHVMNVDGTLSDAEWEIAGLYQVLAFKKAY
jgi:mRNA (guanine-N7-)-methyltransferase